MYILGDQPHMQVGQGHHVKHGEGKEKHEPKHIGRHRFEAHRHEPAGGAIQNRERVVIRGMVRGVRVRLQQQAAGLQPLRHGPAFALGHVTHSMRVLAHIAVKRLERNDHPGHGQGKGPLQEVLEKAKDEDKVKHGRAVQVAHHFDVLLLHNVVGNRVVPLKLQATRVNAGNFDELFIIQVQVQNARVKVRVKEEERGPGQQRVVRRRRKHHAQERKHHGAVHNDAKPAMVHDGSVAHGRDFHWQVVLDFAARAANALSLERGRCLFRHNSVESFDVIHSYLIAMTRTVQDEVLS